MSDDDRDQARELIKKEVDKRGRGLSPRLQRMLKEAFKSKQMWEELRNTYL